MRSEVAARGLSTARRGTAIRSGWLRSRVVALLVGVVAALGCVAAFLALPGGAAGRTTTARRGLTSLPLTAQGPVSAALGHDEPTYRLMAYPLRIDSLIQQGEKLVGDCTSNCANEGTGEIGGGGFGESMAVSADGDTALVGAPEDNGGVGAVWVFTRTEGVWTEQTKLVGDCTSSCSGEGTGEIGEGRFGASVALSSDGDTALIGGSEDNGGAGAAWVFIRSGGVWTQQGAKLVGDCTSGCANEGTGETGNGEFGSKAALSSDGSTALVGGRNDSSGEGAAWVFTRSGGAWTQQGAKLVGDCTSNCANEGIGEVRTGPGGSFGSSVALSADGNTALIGADNDGYNNGYVYAGAAWVFIRSGGAWTQQGAKLVGDCTSNCANEGTGEVHNGSFGSSVALSADGNTALIGAPWDNLGTVVVTGSAWVFARSGDAWVQLGPKLVGNCTSSCANEGTGQTENAFGVSVALSSAGSTALIGGTIGRGAAWLFTRSGGFWVQQGAKLVGDCTSGCSDEGTGETEFGQFGFSVALSADGSTALIGGPSDNNEAGAAWAFKVIGAPAISSVPSLSFGAQTTGQPGAVQWLQVVSSGHAPLAFTGPAQISGADAGDFAIPAGDEQCESRALEPGQVCWIGVQFTARENGSRSATLSFGVNNTTAPDATVSLTGTGVAASSGPAGSNGTNGTNGAQGPAGPQGLVGPTGTQGPTGPEGKEGPAGKVEIVTCTKKGSKQTCKTKLVSGSVKFMPIASAVRATLSRRGRVFATGTVRTVKGHIEFLSSSPRVTLPRGRYTLTITHKAGRHITETREAITIT